MERPQSPEPCRQGEGPDRWNQEFMRFESEAWVYIKQLLDEAVDVAVESYAWRWGDGFGGHLWVHMRQRAEALGQVDHEALLEREARKPRKPMAARTSLAVFARDDYTCRHCGTREGLTVDHIRPVSKGGTDDMDNLQTLCGSCNSRKGDRE